MDNVCRELKAAEVIVDELLKELHELCKLTAKDGRISKLLDKVLLEFRKTPYFDMVAQRKDDFQKASKKMEKLRRTPRTRTISQKSS